MRSVRDIVDELLEAKLPSIKKSHVSAHKTATDIIKSVRQALRGKAGVGVSGLRIYTSDGETLCSDCTKNNWQQIVQATKDEDHSGWAIIGVDHDMNCDDVDQCCHCNKKLGEDVAEAHFPYVSKRGLTLGNVSFREIADHEWQSFRGAESGPNGERPLIADHYTIQDRYGKTYDCTIIVGATGVSVIFDDFKSTEYMYHTTKGAYDDTGDWEAALDKAKELRPPLTIKELEELGFELI